MVLYPGDGEQPAPRSNAKYSFVALIAVCAAALHIWLPLNHDVAWILEGATELLRGAQFGREVIDANPPLAWWLAYIPAAFSEITGCGLAAASVLFTTVFGLAGLVLTDTALKYGSSSRTERDWLLPSLAMLLLIAPAYDFGQREHLMLICAMPYVAAAAAVSGKCRLRWPLAVAIGLFAAIGLCLKPYFLLVPFGVEVWLALRRRSFAAWMRPEFLLTPAFCLIYLGAIVIFAPAYLTVVMPESQSIYWAYNIPFPAVLRSLIIVLLPALTGWLVLLVGERKQFSAFAQTAAVGALGAAVSALLQLKGFSYHFVPAEGLLAASCVGGCLASRTNFQQTALRSVVAMLVIFSDIVPALQQVWNARQIGGTFARVHALEETFRHYAGDKGFIYAFITSPRDIHPAIVASHTRWASEACCIYHLPAAIRAEERPASEGAAIRQAAAHEVDQVLSDLMLRRPAVIVVDAASRKLAFANLSFDYISYLSRDVRFRQLWFHYTERQRIGDFRIFVRTGTARLEDVTHTR